MTCLKEISICGELIKFTKVKEIKVKYMLKNLSVSDVILFRVEIKFYL